MDLSSTYRAIALSLLLVSSAQAEETFPNLPAIMPSPPALLETPSNIQCDSPCVIQFSPGGFLLPHMRQAEWLVDHKVPVILDGPCVSACVNVVMTARDLACFTPRASFWMHKAKAIRGDEVVYMDPPGLPDDLMIYVQGRGGLKATDDPKEMMRIGPLELGLFLRPCNAQEAELALNTETPYQ